MAVQMLGIKTKFTDDQGRPLVGGKVHAYFAGTTTYQDTFKDPDMTIVNTNPIILDDSGSADVYLNGSYRIRVFDKNDVLIEEQDGVTQSASGEITTAKGEIIGLYGAVLNSLTNEVKRAVAAEKTIADSLTSETTRAKSAESALQSSISDETTRAKAAESDLNANIIKEVSDRESEVTRLDEADTILQAQINSVGGGKLAYKTYAEMIADKSNIAAKSSIDIIADTDDKNGTYLYDGTNFVKSQYDLERLIRAKVQNTFGTYAQMVASNLSDGSYALVADDVVEKNGIYIKEGGVWLKSKYNPDVLSKAYTDKVVGSIENSILVRGKNLYNANTATIGKYIENTGVVTDSSGYNITDFIPVSIGSYTMSAKNDRTESFRSIAYYNANKEFIKLDVFSTGSNPKTIAITDSNIAFVRFNFRFGLPTERELMFNNGNEVLPYEPYTTKFADILLNSSQLKQASLFVGATDSAKPYLDNIDSYNLYNPSKITIGEYVDVNGNLIQDKEYFVTDFIPVKPSTYYGISQDIGVNAFRITSYFDVNKNHIKSIYSLTANDGFYAWQTPNNAAYVRLSSNWGDPSGYHRMFFEGNSPLPYKSGVPELSGIKLGSDIIEQINSVIDPKSSNVPYIFDRNLNEVFAADYGVTGDTSWGSKSASDVYTLFDALMADNSKYITKNQLSNDGLGNEVAYYTLKPSKPLIGQESKFPKVVLNVGIHGHEKASVLSAYLFIKSLCENWRDNPILEAMRFGVEFYILPIANPSGWNVNNRKNHNGVDINRNFPYKWNNTLPLDNVRYGGASAASEIETQNIMQMLDDIGNIDIFYDHHNFQGSGDRYLWVSIGGADNRTLERMAQSYISRMTNKWRKEYEWVTQDDGWFAGYSDTAASPSGGVLGNYAMHEIGIKLAATFEVCDNWTINRSLPKYGDVLAKTGLEALVNWLAINLVNIHHYRG